MTDTTTPPLPADAFLARFGCHAAQAAFVACPERFCLYVGGVGAGKTTAGALRAIARAIGQPGSLGLVGAPTYPMLRDATARTFFALLPDELPYKFNKSEQHLRLDNGSEILFRSLDEPDRLRGLTLAWFWLDEAPLAGYGAWRQLKARLRQPGYELAGWATGTPHGRDGYYRDFAFHPLAHHALFRAATSANAANLPPDYEADLGLSSALYEQEVLGRFTAFEGLVYAFDANALDGHVHEPFSDGQYATIIGGVDWGYTNPTAAAIFGVDGDERAWQVAELYLPKASLHETVYPALCELTARHGVTLWYAGPDEPEHIEGLRAALRRADLGARVVAADDAVVPGIQTVTRQLALRGDGTRGLIVAPSCVWTIAEYGSYQYPPAERVAGLDTPAGARPLSEAPLKANDHLMDATRYALHTHFSQARRADDWMREWLGQRGHTRE